MLGKVAGCEMLNLYEEKCKCNEVKNVSFLRNLDFNQVKKHLIQVVEGYGRRIYKAEYLKFIVYALASNDETRDHLETLYTTKSLNNEQVYQSIHDKVDLLGRKLHNFYKSIEANHKGTL